MLLLSESSAWPASGFKLFTICEKRKMTNTINVGATWGHPIFDHLFIIIDTGREGVDRLYSLDH